MGASYDGRMPRHDPDLPPCDEPGPVGRRLSSAVGAREGPGLLGEAPIHSGAGEQSTADSFPGCRGPRIRWRTGRQAAGLLCLVSLALIGWFWWQSANPTATVSPISSASNPENSEAPLPEPDAVPQTGADSEPGGSGSSARGGSGDGGTGKIIVHVAGAVLRAGIVELPQGSRLHEAIAAAGGSATDADPDQLNLAAVLEDGQKVLVPRQGETAPDGDAAAGGRAPAAGEAARGTPAVGAGSPPAAGKVNLNTAGADELASLPRVGPVLAQRIVDWRMQHGKFQRVEELDAVDGIGPKLLAALLPLVRV